MADKITQDRKQDANRELNLNMPDLDGLSLDNPLGAGGVIDGSGRKPSSPTKTIAIEGLKGVGSGIGDGIAAELYKAMPSLGPIVGEVTQGYHEFKDLKTELAGQLSPMMVGLEDSARKLLPRAKKFVPKALYDKVHKKLDDRYKERQAAAYPQMTKQQMEADQISSELGQIFGVPPEQAQQQAIEQKKNELTNMALDSARHKATTVQLSHVYESLRATELFHRTIHTSYMRKSLELKYKHLFVARDTYNLLARSMATFEGYYKGLLRNTALPDMMKIQIGDYHRRNVTQKYGELMADFKGNIRKKIFEKIKSTAKSAVQRMGLFADQVGMVAGMSEMGDQMGMTDQNTGAGLLARGAGWVLGRLGMGSVAKHYLGKVRPMTDNLDNTLKHFKANAYLKAAHLRRRWASGNKMERFLSDFLPEMARLEKGSNDLLTKPNDAAVFDTMTRQSIVEIIPGYLGKILHSLEKQRTGDENVSETVYDVYSRKFDTVENLKEHMAERMYGNESSRRQLYINAIGALHTGIDRNTKGMSDDRRKEESDFLDEIGPDLNRFMVNHAVHAEFLDIDQLREFVNTNGKSAEYSTYIKYVTMGMKHNPVKVIQSFLRGVLKEDGSVDQNVVNSVTASISDYRDFDSYKVELARAGETYGYRTYLSDKIGTKEKNALLKQVQEGGDKGKEAAEKLKGKLGLFADNNELNMREIARMLSGVDYADKDNADRINLERERTARDYENFDLGAQQAREFAEKSGIADAYRAARDIKDRLVGGAKKKGKAAYDWLGGIATDASKWTEDTVNKAASFIETKEGRDKFYGNLRGSFDAVKEYGGQAVDSVKRAINDPQEAYRTAKDVISRKATQYRQQFEDSEAGKKVHEVIDSVQKRVDSAIESGTEFYEAKTPDSVKKFLNDAVDIAKKSPDYAKDLVERLKTAYGEHVPADVREQINTVLTTVKETTAEKSAEAARIVTQLMNDPSYREQKLHQVTDTTHDIIEEISAATPKSKEEVIEKMTKMGQKIPVPTSEELKSSAEELKSVFAKALTEAINSIKDVTGAGTGTPPPSAPPEMPSDGSNKSADLLTQLLNLYRDNSEQQKQDLADWRAKLSEDHEAIFSAVNWINKTLREMPPAIASGTAMGGGPGEGAEPKYGMWGRGGAKVKRMFRAGIHGAGVALNKVGKVYTHIYGKALEGAGHAIGGLGNMVGKGFTTLGQYAGAVGKNLPTILDKVGGGLKNLGKGYVSIYNTALKGIGGTAKVVAEGLFGSRAIPYVDVYRKDEVGGAYKPILTAAMQERDPGVFFGNGKRVRNSEDITEPVFDVAGKPIISDSDIEHGLVGADNKPISTKKGSRGLLNGGLIGKVLGIAKGLAPGIGKGIGSIAELYKNVYTKLFGFALDGAKGVGKMAGKFINRLFGFDVGGVSKEMSANVKMMVDFMKTTNENVALIRADVDLIARRKKKGSKAGDKDGDGDIDGTYEDQMQQKAAGAGAAGAGAAAGAAGDKKGPRTWREIARDMFGRAPGDPEKGDGEGSGFFEDMLKWKIFTWVGGKFKKFGHLAKLLGKGNMVKGIGKAISGYSGRAIKSVGKAFGKGGAVRSVAGKVAGAFGKGGVVRSAAGKVAGAFGSGGAVRTAASKTGTWIAEHGGSKIASAFAKDGVIRTGATKLAGTAAKYGGKVLGATKGGLSKAGTWIATHGGSKIAGMATKATGAVGAKVAAAGGAKAVGSMAGKFLGRAAGPLAAITELGFGGYDAYKAFKAGDNRGGSKAVGGAVGGAGGALAGAALGASIGSVVPGLGTAIGGLLGGVIGSLAGGGAGKWVGGKAHDAIVKDKGILKYSPVVGLIRGIRGNDNEMTEKEIEQGRKKLQRRVEKGAPGYDKILDEYNKAVEEKNWKRARQLSGKEADGVIASLWKHSITGAVIGGTAGFLVKGIIGDKNAEMSKEEIEKVRAKYQSIMKKGGSGAKKAEKLLSKFDDYVADENWKEARKLANMEKTGLWGTIFGDSHGKTQWGKVAGVAAGALLGGPIGALLGYGVGALFTKADVNKPMTEKEVADARARLLKLQESGNKAAGKILNQFDEAVTEMNWKKARQLVGEEVQSNLSKLGDAAKSTVKWTARIATLGLSTLFEADQEKPMSNEEIKKFTDKMNFLIKKGDKRAEKKLEKFEEAVAAQKWEKARQIARMPVESKITKAAKATWSWFFGDDEKPMTEEEMQKFRDSMNRKIQMGSKMAQKKLDAFEDAVGAQRWKRARVIAKAPDDGAVQKTGKAIASAAVGTWRFLFGGDGKAMSDNELATARKRMEWAVTEGKKGAQKRLDLFNDYVKDEKWEKARALAKMPYENALSRAKKAVTGWLFGDDTKELSAEEIDKFRGECEQRIADGNKKAEKILKEFNKAVDLENWEQARKLAGYKDWGIVGSVGKGIKKVWDFFAGNSDYDDCMKIKEELEEKSLDDETGMIDKGLQEFMKLVRRQEYNAAMELAEDLKKLKPNEIKKKYKISTDEYEKIGKDAEALLQRINKNIDKEKGWLPSIKKMRLVSLRNKLTGNPGDWNSEFLDDIREKMASITGEDEFENEDKPEDPAVKEGEQLVKDIEHAQEKFGWLTSPIKRAKLASLKSEVQSDLTTWCDETIKEWKNRLREIDDTYNRNGNSENGGGYADEDAGKEVEEEVEVVDEEVAKKRKRLSELKKKEFESRFDGNMLTDKEKAELDELRQAEADGNLEEGATKTVKQKRKIGRKLKEDNGKDDYEQDAGSDSYSDAVKVSDADPFKESGDHLLTEKEKAEGKTVSGAEVKNGHQVTAIEKALEGTSSEQTDKFGVKTRRWYDDSGKHTEKDYSAVFEKNADLKQKVEADEAKFKAAQDERFAMTKAAAEQHLQKQMDGLEGARQIKLRGAFSQEDRDKINSEFDKRKSEILAKHNEKLDKLQKEHDTNVQMKMADNRITQAEKFIKKQTAQDDKDAAYAGALMSAGLKSDEEYKAKMKRLSRLQQDEFEARFTGGQLSEKDREEMAELLALKNKVEGERESGVSEAAKQRVEAETAEDQAFWDNAKKNWEAGADKRKAAGVVSMEQGKPVVAEQPAEEEPHTFAGKFSMGVKNATKATINAVPDAAAAVATGTVNVAKKAIAGAGELATKGAKAFTKAVANGTATPTVHGGMAPVATTGKVAAATKAATEPKPNRRDGTASMAQFYSDVVSDVESWPAQKKLNMLDLLQDKYNKTEEIESGEERAIAAALGVDFLDDPDEWDKAREMIEMELGGPTADLPRQSSKNGLYQYSESTEEKDGRKTTTRKFHGMKIANELVGDELTKKQFKLMESVEGTSLFDGYRNNPELMKMYEDAKAKWGSKLTPEQKERLSELSQQEMDAAFSGGAALTEDEKKELQDLRALDGEDDDTPEAEKRFAKGGFSKKLAKRKSSASSAESLAAQIIKKYEGFSAKPYICPAGKKTIGYGFTDKKSLAKKEMTEAEASEILTSKIKGILSKIDSEVPGLSDDQRAALCSFIFNLGFGNFKSSTLLKRLKEGDWDKAVSEIKRWDKATVNGEKKTLKGLTKRRAEEATYLAKAKGEADSSKLIASVKNLSKKKFEGRFAGGGFLGLGKSDLEKYSDGIDSIVDPGSQGDQTYERLFDPNSEEGRAQYDRDNMEEGNLYDRLMEYEGYRGQRKMIQDKINENNSVGTKFKKFFGIRHDDGTMYDTEGNAETIEQQLANLEKDRESDTFEQSGVIHHQIGGKTWINKLKRIRSDEEFEELARQYRLLKWKNMHPGQKPPEDMKFAGGGYAGTDRYPFGFAGKTSRMAEGGYTDEQQSADPVPPTDEATDTSSEVAAAESDDGSQFLTKPTTSVDADGNTVLAGEANTEAIIPLTKRPGNLLMRLGNKIKSFLTGKAPEGETSIDTTSGTKQASVHASDPDSEPMTNYLAKQISDIVGKPVTNGVEQFFGDAKDAITRKRDSIMEAFQQNHPEVAEAASKTVDGIKDFGSSIVDRFSGLFKDGGFTDTSSKTPAEAFHKPEAKPAETEWSNQVMNAKIAANTKAGNDTSSQQVVDGLSDQTAKTEEVLTEIRKLVSLFSEAFKGGAIKVAGMDSLAAIMANQQPTIIEQPSQQGLPNPSNGPSYDASRGLDFRKLSV